MFSSDIIFGNVSRENKGDTNSTIIFIFVVFGFRAVITIGCMKRMY